MEEVVGGQPLDVHRLDRYERTSEPLVNAVVVGWKNYSVFDRKAKLLEDTGLVVDEGGDSARVEAVEVGNVEKTNLVLVHGAPDLFGWFVRLSAIALQRLDLL
jgi:hypothetical protein